MKLAALWIVRDPSPDSELVDVVFEVDVHRLGKPLRVRHRHTGRARVLLARKRAIPERVNRRWRARRLARRGAVRVRTARRRARAGATVMLDRLEPRVHPQRSELVMTDPKHHIDLHGAALDVIVIVSLTILTALHIATLTVFLAVVGPIVGARLAGRADAPQRQRRRKRHDRRHARCLARPLTAAPPPVRLVARPSRRRRSLQLRIPPPMPNSRPHAVDPSVATARALFVYKTSAYDSPSHVGLGVIAAATAKTLRREGIWAEACPRCT
jgi:hypothetical protein